MNPTASNPMAEVTDLKSVQSGFDSQEAECLRLYENLVHRVVRNHYRPPFNYEDMLSLAYEALIKAHRDYDSNASAKFMTLAYTCIRNILLTYIRDFKYLQSIEDLSSVPAKHTPPPAVKIPYHILSPVQAYIIINYGHQTQEELAATLGRKRATIQKHWINARDKLRRYYAISDS